MLTNRNLKQVITYWALGPTRDDYNEVSFVAPILLKGRWTVNSVTVTKPNGDEIVSKAVVYVDRDVVNEGFLAPGNFTSIPSPRSVAGAMEIQAFQSTPDLRNMEQNRKAFL